MNNHTQLNTKSPPKSEEKQNEKAAQMELYNEEAMKALDACQETQEERCDETE